jgi:hypothetical protein
MNQWYEAPCPVCGHSVQCAPADLLGFPEPETSDDDPLKTACEACGTVLHMTWTVSLSAEALDDDE